MRHVRQAKRLAFVLTFLALSACGSGADRSATGTDPLLPFPYEEARDLDDSVLIASLQEIMKARGGPLNSRFDYTRIDLDNDGRKDALVYMKTPFQYWCGQHGCSMFVMRAGLETFELVSEIEPLRPPMIVANDTTNGWRDLIVRIDGRWSKTKDVALQFDGHDYPGNPEQAPTARTIAWNEGVIVFQ
ncbi:MAG: hypothetical protein EOM26_02560 [Alphaproteobacteria bacterium]|nr:hypothetical protein [Alphaproteobacteria bacterium]